MILVVVFDLFDVLFEFAMSTPLKLKVKIGALLRLKNIKIQYIEYHNKLSKNYCAKL